MGAAPKSEPSYGFGSRRFKSKQDGFNHLHQSLAAQFASSSELIRGSTWDIVPGTYFQSHSFEISECTQILQRPKIVEVDPRNIEIQKILLINLSC